MAMKLEDLIGKKKEVAQVLDLSKASANTQEELRKLLDKVPEFRIKPEKIKVEDIKIQDKVTRIKKKRSKSGKKTSTKKYLFGNPIPQEMRSIQLDDVCSVGIQWNMLTTLRPKNKLDEEYFSRIVELGKLRLQTEEKENKFPESYYLRKMKNKAGLVETRYISCAECGEEFCDTETCCLFQYDQFRRENPADGPAKPEAKERGRQRTKKKIKKARKKTKRKTSTPGDLPRKKSKQRKSKSEERPSDSTEKKKKKERPKSKPRSKSAPGTNTKRTKPSN